MCVCVRARARVCVCDITFSLQCLVNISFDRRNSVPYSFKNTNIFEFYFDHVSAEIFCAESLIISVTVPKCNSFINCKLISINSIWDTILNYM